MPRSCPRRSLVATLLFDERDFDLDGWYRTLEPQPYQGPGQLIGRLLRDPDLDPAVRRAWCERLVTHPQWTVWTDGAGGVVWTLDQEALDAWGLELVGHDDRFPTWMALIQRFGREAEPARRNAWIARAEARAETAEERQQLEDLCTRMGFERD